MTDIQRKDRFRLIAYLVGFCLIIVVRVLIYINFDSQFESDTLRMISSSVSRVLIWIVPVFLCLIYVDKTNPFGYLRLSGSLKSGLLWSVGILVAGTVLQVVLLRLGMDKLGEMSVSGLVGSIIIAVAEEIPMRGFVLRKMTEIMGLSRALIFSSLFFVAVHWPGWMLINHYPVELMLQYSVSIFAIVGVCGGLVVVKSNSLYPAIVLHWVNNFVSSG